MCAVAIVGTSGLPSPDLSDTCRIVLLCEDAAAREKAMAVCERLAGQFGDELFFDFSCWNVPDLARPTLARRAAQAAAAADVVVFAMHGDDLPGPVREWAELCAAQRSKREGALGVLVAEPVSASASIGALLSRLELIAARWGVDFLPLMPLGGERLDGQNERATAVTSLLREMLNQPPSHWGLNE